MRTTFRTVARMAAAVAFAAGIAVPAVAQQPLKIDFHNGLVSVDANAVPVRTILTEWGRLGGTKIVGAERISGSPLTLRLVDVTEAKALETILRSVAGYMAAPRGVAAAGPSMYDRILVMATTSAPAPVSTARPQPSQPNAAFNGTQRLVPPRQQRPEQAEPDEQDEPDENPPNPPVFTFPQGGVNQPGQFNGNPGNQPGQNVINVNPSNGGAPQGITISPSTTPGQPTAPGVPIGVATPGMMVQPPQQQQPNQPGTMIRPPGRQQQ